MARPNIRLSDAIDEYLSHRKVRPDIKPNTVRNDACYLGRFLTATGNIYVKSVAQKHVDAFFAENEELGVSSKNLIISILNGFFKFCRQRKWMSKDENPTEGYRSSKVPKKEMLRVPVQDFPKLMDAAEHPRNRMVVALGLFLFLRSSEIRSIRIGDVDLDLGEIAVTIHKSDDTDIMQINPQLDRELRRYLTWYAEHHGPLKPEWFLIPSKNSIHWKQEEGTGKFVPNTSGHEVRLRPSCQVNALEKVVQEALSKIGYPTYWQGIHTLRRSGARAFYNELCDRMGDNSALEVVSSMLHHANLVITQRYLGIQESRKRRDKVIMEAPMFPILEPQENVIELRGASVG